MPSNSITLEIIVSLFSKFVPSGGEIQSDSDPLGPESPEQRESCVRNDLLLRLRNVCKDLPEEEFQKLILAMTREQLRSERLR